MPLTVTRTYNSFNQDQGDFGYSWTYAINDVNLQLDEDRELARLYGTRAYNRARERFTARRMVDDYMRLYRRLRTPKVAVA